MSIRFCFNLNVSFEKYFGRFLIGGYYKYMTKMVKRKRVTDEKDVLQANHSVHVFTDEEITELRRDLLQWYSKNKRDLPWRQQAKQKNINQRGYAVWVSEVMLQQTQVATVIDYYNRWLKKWPTLEKLAEASLEEVNEMWAGLGYYSRGKRLHEGAKKVVQELDGQMPTTADALVKQLPGVGRYTAGAVASIAFGQATGLVDGNVSRVFARLRILGSDIQSQTAIEALWALANKTVHPKTPGDFNQALMELGATVCTPKTPDCPGCPIRTLCKAYAQVEHEKKLSAAKLVSKRKELPGVVDIEDIVVQDDCPLCLANDEPWDSSLGVLNYPRKGKKKAPREEMTAVCVTYRQTSSDETEYLLLQRPSTGLLAGLWEFPSVLVELESTVKTCLSAAHQHMMSRLQLNEPEIQEVEPIGEVSHIFSHIRQRYIVSSCAVNVDQSGQILQQDDEARWLTRSQLLDAAVPTAMKKVFRAFENRKKAGPKESTKKKPKKKVASDGKKQLALDSFFRVKQT